MKTFDAQALRVALEQYLEHTMADGGVCRAEALTLMTEQADTVSYDISAYLSAETGRKISVPEGMIIGWVLGVSER